MLTETSVRDTHNDMIKPYANGGLKSSVDSVTKKSLIINTVLGCLLHHKFIK